MRFTVPQFTEEEARVIGPLSFRQFVFVGIAGTICFILYFLIGQDYFFLFLILSIAVLAAGIGLAFLKVSGQGLPTILLNFFRFSFASKLYIWKKGGAKITFSKNLNLKKELRGEDLPLKADQGGRLRKIKTDIETKTR